MTRAQAPERVSKTGSDDASVPRHVAIIMDGNGRWAMQRGLPRVAGHRAGAEALRKTMRAAAEMGIAVLTIYAFSSENWRRSADEIADLTGLMRFYLEREVAEVHREGVRMTIVGDYRAFGPELVAQLDRAVELTRDNIRMTLAIALNYGSRAEIANAARSLARRAAAGSIDPETIDERSIEGELYTRELPPLDLLIRTSGEVRLSNFMLWQSAYSELLFTDVMWPDFDGAQLATAVSSFARRDRRFGGR